MNDICAECGEALSPSRGAVLVVGTEDCTYAHKRLRCHVACLRPLIDSRRGMGDGVAHYHIREADRAAWEGTL